MELDSKDIKRLIEWVNAVEDLNRSYLEPEDFDLAKRLKDAHSRETPQVVNQDAPGDLRIGEYVFASRWSDCDPGDPWNVGHVSEIGDGFIVCGDASPRRWPKAMRITKEQGARICAEFPILEETNPSDYAAIAEVFGVSPV